MSNKIKTIKTILAKKFDDYNENDIKTFSSKCDEIADVAYNLYDYAKTLKDQLEILGNDSKTGFSFQILYSTLKEFNYYSDRICDIDTDEVVNFISRIIEDLKKIIKNKKKNKKIEEEIEQNIVEENPEENKEENIKNTEENNV